MCSVFIQTWFFYMSGDLLVHLWTFRSYVSSSCYTSSQWIWYECQGHVSFWAALSSTLILLPTPISLLVSQP